MKRTPRTHSGGITPATTPEFFADDMPFNLVSETIAATKATSPIIQTQLFATSEILSFPPTKLDCHNRGTFSNERRGA